MSSARSAGYRSVFAVPEFRAVFAAHVLSMLGEVLAEIALSVLVYRLTGSPLLSALSLALGLLPYALCGTLLSSVADRFPTRRVLVGCDLLCAAGAAGLVVPGMPVAALLVMRCLLAAVAPVFTGTRAATLTDILGTGDRYVLGRSVIRLVSQSAQLAGFGIGGVLLLAVSPRGVLAVTTATFLASALVLRLGTRARAARTTAGPLLGSSLGAVRWLLADRRIRSLLLLAWVPPMFVVVGEALLTPLAAAAHASSGWLGLLMCGMPVGAVLGETLAGSLLGARGRARLMAPAALWAAVPSLAYAFDPPLWVCLACQVATGLAITYSLGLDRRFLAAVPESLRGSALTLLTAGQMTAQGLAMTVAGAAADVVPVPTVIAAGGVLGVLLLPFVLWQVHLADRAGTGTPVPLAGQA
ncbi:MFS transporter [Actinocatenispora comari]|uniref:MFS transporter n=1 Tax=Actinocatenispora comari TaxID=2807577 RepID=UPI001A9165D0|nr:MFS transporter [Actinocatenispora comari]